MSSGGAGSSAPDTILRLLAGWRATGPITTLSAGLAMHQSNHGFDHTFASPDAAYTTPSTRAATGSSYERPRLQPRFEH